MVSRHRISSSVVLASSIHQYYQDMCWCHRAAQIPDLEGSTRIGVEHHVWHGAVPDISEWGVVVQSVTDQRRASQSGVDQDGSVQVAFRIIRY